MSKNIYIILLLIFLTTSCTDVAVSGAQALYNQHNLKKSFNDQYITMQAFKKIEIDRRDFNNTNIAIATFHNEVLLAGEVPEKWQRDEAEKMVREIPDVKQVYNLVQISNPSPTLKRISDVWITAKVKSKLIVSDDLDANQVKVVTENGTVYLMGYLQPNEAEAAVDIASTTAGVERVVKIFSYWHLSKN